MRILIADDHALFRDGLSMIINSTIPDTKILPANDWNEASTLAKQQPFDIALLDLFMPSDNTWELELSNFISQNPHIPTCIISSSNNKAHIKQAFNLGAKGYIQKTSGMQEINSALTKITNGGHYTPRSNWQRFAPEDETANLKLTWRQKEILMLMAEGSSNKQIGLVLEISESTVKRHVYNLFRALGAKNRVDAVRIAETGGLLAKQ